LFIFNNLALSLVSLSSLLALAEHHSNHLLRDHFSPLGQAVLSFLLFDLSLYVWHWASHRFPWLWQFHRIHHSDLTMNVSTAFRVHALDHLTMALTKAAYIILFGFSEETVILNETANTAFLIFHHSNLAFRGEKWLGNLIIVPSLHRLHHSMQRQEHNKNYGAVLSIWDRLFNTFAETEPEKLGIKETLPQDMPGLIKAGFILGTPVLLQEANMPSLEAMIAEAAYYRAEKRNFSPGHEIRDWLEAKQEIIKQLYGNKPVGGRSGSNATAYTKRQICC
jgi:sterol desaturase/sphingolipid hydroxylase (fatty acid hydroxylase superfamily)